MNIRSKVLRRSHSALKTFSSQQRDSRYVFVALLSLPLLLLTTLQALNNGLFDSVERPIFQAVNSLPGSWYDAMYILTQFGGLGTLVLWAGLAWYLINRRAALTVAASGLIGWFLAKVLKVLVHRGRPGDILDEVRLFAGEQLGGFGFPSGHATFAAACATVLYFQVKPRYRKYLLLAVLLVGISRMYIGAHFPLDIVGGWALGALVGASISLLVGASGKGLSVSYIKRILARKGYDIKELRFANLDARGSRPLFMTTTDGTRYFGKIFGKQEHAADWLFKLYRLFRYKNLQAEEPYINSRRNVEMEALATLWARQAGVRAAGIVDVVQTGSSWLLIQDLVPAKALAEHSRLRQKSLEDAWVQVNKLHASNLAHRDLRAANLMVDSMGQAWIIDFGFAEVAPRPQRQYMDIAELLMSMSLVVGVKRTVDAAVKVSDPERLKKAMPFLQRSVFSGATAKQLKAHKEILQELKDTLCDRLDFTDEVVEADILRVNRKKLLNIVLLAVFVYVIIPQFKQFSGVVDSLSDINVLWLLPLALASALTYYLTGIIYVALADIPLKIYQSSLVQLASSFVSKVLPGGLASASMNARYLTKSGLAGSETSAVIAAQGIISLAMFVLPLGLFMVLNGRGISELISIDVSPKLIVLVPLVALAATIILSLAKGLRQRLQEAVAKFIASIRDLSSSGRDVSYAAVASLGVTLAYIACLYAACQAFGLNLGISAIVLIYASAVIAKSAIPTPGGLGPLEVAMVSSMIGLGIARPEALGVVILYRLATFWLPVPFSMLAYRYITKKRLI